MCVRVLRNQQGYNVGEREERHCNARYRVSIVDATSAVKHRVSDRFFKFKTKKWRCLKCLYKATGEDVMF